MGNKFSVTELLGLTCLNDAIKYVFNDFTCHSECAQCCSTDCQSNPIALQDDGDDVNLSYDSEGGLSVRMKSK